MSGVGPPIQVVCTDRRQHKPMRFGRGPGEYVDGALDVKCPGCKRELRLSPERFGDIVAALQAAGVEELDVSALPARVRGAR